LFQRNQSIDAQKVIDLLLSSLQNGKPACIIPLSVFSRPEKAGETAMNAIAAAVAMSP